jgi:hypothetical protein
MKTANLILAAALLLPATASGQDANVARRTFSFIDSRLEVAVVSGAPGELQVVRGEAGRVDVAARSADGFPGFGLGGSPTRQLRLTALGAESVSYLVVVPEHVSVRVMLPEGSTADIAPYTASSTYRWTAVSEVRLPDGSRADPGSPAIGALRTGALPVVHRSVWVPEVVNVPDLAAVRSLSLRVEGDDFRVAASRPMVMEPGSRSRVDVRVAGEPLDLVLYVPRTAAFALYSGETRLAEAADGLARALCGNVVAQAPTPEQSWVSFHPWSGRLDCR